MAFFKIQKTCSKDELIVRKSTVRFTAKQELFVKQKKVELYMDRVLERKIKGFLRKNMFIQKEEECLFKRVRLIPQWQK